MSRPLSHRRDRALRLILVLALLCANAMAAAHGVDHVDETRGSICEMCVGSHSLDGGACDIETPNFWADDQSAPLDEHFHAPLADAVERPRARAPPSYS